MPGGVEELVNVLVALVLRRHLLTSQTFPRCIYYSQLVSRSSLGGNEVDINYVVMYNNTLMPFVKNVKFKDEASCIPLTANWFVSQKNTPPLQVIMFGYLYWPYAVSLRICERAIFFKKPQPKQWRPYRNVSHFGYLKSISGHVTSSYTSWTTDGSKLELSPTVTRNCSQYRHY